MELLIDGHYGMQTRSMSSLKASLAQNMHHRSAPGSPSPPTNHDHRRTALVVDDNLVIRLTAAKMLQKLGFYVEVAKDGIEGLAAMQTKMYSLVLCDIDMPNMDGLTAVSHFRGWECMNRQDHHQIVMCVTGEEETRVTGEEIRRAGMDQSMRKPYNMLALEGLVNLL